MDIHCCETSPDLSQSILTRKINKTVYTEDEDNHQRYEDCLVKEC